jgi:hypothetical protein
MNTIKTETDHTNLNENFETIERAISERLPEFDVHSSQLPPPAAGWMRRALRKNLQRLAELKKLLEEQP